MLKHNMNFLTSQMVYKATKTHGQSYNLSALDQVSISAPCTGIRKLQHAMMDIDNAVFCMSVTQLALQSEMTETKLIKPPQSE
jgi:hypothetical protein